MVNKDKIKRLMPLFIFLILMTIYVFAIDDLNSCENGYPSFTNVSKGSYESACSPNPLVRATTPINTIKETFGGVAWAFKGNPSAIALLIIIVVVGVLYNIAIFKKMSKE